MAIGVSIKGDFAKLMALGNRIEAMSKAKFRIDLNRLLGAEALKLVQMGFRNSADPYGNAWAPLKHRKGKPLLDTGRLRSSFSAQSDWAGFTIGTNVTYAKFHQYGTTGRKKASTQRRFTGAGGAFVSHAKAMSLSKIAGSRALADTFRNERHQKQISRLQSQLDRMNKRGSSKRKRSGPISPQERTKQAVGTTRKARIRGRIKAIGQKMAARAGARTVVNFRFVTFAAGSGKMVARVMVPERDLPDTWAKAFESTTKRFVSRLMRAK